MGRIITYKKLQDSLEQLFSASNYCQAHCSKLPNGCCKDNYHELLDSGVQDLEIIDQFTNLQGGNKDYSQPCYYHSSKGCNALYKSPLCLSFICTPFKKHLAANYNIHYPSKGGSWMDMEKLLINILDGKTSDVSGIIKNRWKY